MCGRFVPDVTFGRDERATPVRPMTRTKPLTLGTLRKERDIE